MTQVIISRRRQHHRRTVVVVGVHIGKNYFYKNPTIILVLHFLKIASRCLIYNWQGFLSFSLLELNGTKNANKCNDCFELEPFKMYPCTEYGKNKKIHKILRPMWQRR